MGREPSASKEMPPFWTKMARLGGFVTVSFLRSFTWKQPFKTAGQRKGWDK